MSKESSEISFDDPLIKSEPTEDILKSDEIKLETELEDESIDCKETIKLEIKQEIQETVDLQDLISTEVIEQDLQESSSVE